MKETKSRPKAISSVKVDVLQNIHEGVEFNKKGKLIVSIHDITTHFLSKTIVMPSEHLQHVKL